MVINIPDILSASLPFIDYLKEDCMSAYTYLLCAVLLCCSRLLILVNTSSV